MISSRSGVARPIEVNGSSVVCSSKAAITMVVSRTAERTRAPLRSAAVSWCPLLGLDRATSHQHFLDAVERHRWFDLANLEQAAIAARHVRHFPDDDALWKDPVQSRGDD